MQKLSIRWTFKIALIAWTALLFAIPASAEWYKDYESAMDMVKKGQAGEAIPKLQAAISQKNDEGLNIKFYGMKFGDYLPHFYLGQAYFSQKNYDAALKEFEASERFGAIQRKNNLYDQMMGSRTLARAQIALRNQPQVASNTTPNIVAPTNTIPVNTVPSNNSTTVQTTNPTNVATNKTEPAKEETKAAELPRDKTSVPESKTVAELKKEALEQQQLLQKKLEEQQKAAQATNPPPVDANAELAKFMAKSGAQKYFEGDYDGAIVYLSGAIAKNSKDASVQFLLGCSYASKYLLTGSASQDLMKNASDAFQRSKKLNPSYSPKNKTYFSPVVLQLFAKA